MIGSGNIVHNLSQIVWSDTAHPWAVEFDERIARAIRSRDHQSIIHYAGLGAAAGLAVPTNEHFLPLLYVLAMREEREDVAFFAEKVTLGAISMRSLRVG